jgi:hypothetical protein
MKCEIIRNGNTIVSEMDFNVNRVRDIVARQGGDYRLVPNALTAAIHIGSIQILPVKYDMPVTTQAQRCGKPVRTVSDSLVTYSYPVEEKTEDELRNELLTQVSRIHESYDSGRMEYQGVSIAVDLEARVNAEGVLKRFERGLMSATQWNGQAVTSTDENGNEVTGPSKVAIGSTADMQALYDAVFAHLEAGFIAKEMLKAELESADAVTLATVDVNARWNEIVETL